MLDVRSKEDEYQLVAKSDLLGEGAGKERERGIVSEVILVSRTTRKKPLNGEIVLLQSKGLWVERWHLML